jgi:POT family proton-dependent oligopeptide transporter
MAKSKYLTAPIPSEKMPAGIPYILGNEAAERFSFYGMTSILVIFMTRYLVGPDGVLDVMTDSESLEIFHYFRSGVYFMPLVGALLADIWLAKYRTIMWFSILYCFGFLAMVFDITRLGLFAGLILIAVGSGIIKPCVSANVGDQFGKTNKRLMAPMFSWFYFSVNLGACVSMLLCPWILDEYGVRAGFGVPAAFMILATVAFWLGKRKFVHIPRGGTEFVKETFSGEGIKAIAKLCIIFVFVAMFWALFDQSQSAWVLQAEKMQLKWLGIGWLPAQVQFVNSLLIMLLIPLFSYVIYPAIDKIFPLTALRKIGIGLFVGVLSFVVPAWVEGQIDGGDIFKCSSRSTIAGLEPIRLIDGLTDGSGWSSDRAPSLETPVEIVIRLRERKAWNVSSVGISPATTLSYREIVSMLDDVALDTLGQIKEQREAEAPRSDIAALQRKVDQMKTAAGEAKKAAKRARKGVSKQQRRSAAAQAAKDVALRVMTEHGADTTCLDDAAYSPREVSVFAGDFSDRLLPTPLFELSDEEREDTADVNQYAIEAGWTHLGDYTLDRARQDVSSINFQDFDPVQATHVMIQIKSNYGADRVKIAETLVQTDQAIPAESKATAGEVWPNVAALGYKPSVGWQFFAYLILTAAEIMISITCLEFSYTQSPKKMKSFIMAVYLLSISLGNAFTAVVNASIQNADQRQHSERRRLNQTRRSGLLLVLHDSDARDGFSVHSRSQTISRQELHTG